MGNRQTHQSFQSFNDHDSPIDFNSYHANSSSSNSSSASQGGGGSHKFTTKLINFFKSKFPSHNSPSNNDNSTNVHGKSFFQKKSPKQTKTRLQLIKKRSQKEKMGNKNNSNSGVFTIEDNSDHSSNFPRQQQQHQPQQDIKEPSRLNRFLKMLSSSRSAQYSAAPVDSSHGFNGHHAGLTI